MVVLAYKIPFNFRLSLASLHVYFHFLNVVKFKQEVCFRKGHGLGLHWPFCDIHCKSKSISFTVAVSVLNLALRQKETKVTSKKKKKIRNIFYTFIFSISLELWLHTKNWTEWPLAFHMETTWWFKEVKIP